MVTEISSSATQLEHHNSKPRQPENNDNTENQEQMAPVRINLPYVKGTNEQLRRIFNDISHFRQLQHHVYFSHMQNILYPQSKETSLSILKYDCKDCEAVYFGESKQTLAGRTKEHTRAVRAADTRRYKTADRCWKYNNNDFDWETRK